MSAATPAWDVSGPETVADGVHRVPLPLPEDGLRAVNVYLLEDTEGLTLIDAGWALDESAELLDKAIRALGYEGGDVHDILVTHVHRDHYTQAMWLRRDHGARVSLGAGERTGLDRLFEIRTNVPVDSLDQVRLAGVDELAAELEVAEWPAFDPSSWGYPDRWIGDGDVFGPVVAVATPGHTRGHMVFHDAGRALMFAGDHILPGITPSIGFELGRPPMPLGDYLTSLRVVLDREDARLLPAHGPVTDSCRDRVLDLIEHHRERFLAVLDVIDDRGSTAWQVASRLVWTRRARRFADLDSFNQMLAVCETAAHLDVLVSHGALFVPHRASHRVYARTGHTSTPLTDLVGGRFA